MIQVRVIRGVGDIESPEPIINNLISNEAVATERGRNYLDDVGFDKLMYNVTIPFRKWLRSEKLIYVVDASLGEAFMAKVVSCSISYSVVGDVKESTQTLTIERSVSNG